MRACAWFRECISANRRGQVGGEADRLEVFAHRCVSCASRFAVCGCPSRLRRTQDMGKLYGEPQTTASLRLGTMYHYGMVPFLGHNATEALAYYQEVREGGGGAGRQYGAAACANPWARAGRCLPSSRMKCLTWLRQHVDKRGGRMSWPIGAGRSAVQSGLEVDRVGWVASNSPSDANSGMCVRK